MKFEIIKKAWIHNLDLDEPWHAFDSVYHGTRGQAKTKCLSDYCYTHLADGTEIETILHINIKRSPQNDIIIYKGEEMRRYSMADKINTELRKESIKGHEEEFFYVQDKRDYVGNSVLWWGINGNGYVCHLPNAHRYTKQEVLKGFPWRETDIIWAESLVLKGVRQHVDCQYLNREEAI